jgi:hypothetical protein
MAGIVLLSISLNLNKLNEMTLDEDLTHGDGEVPPQEPKRVSSLLEALEHLHPLEEEFPNIEPLLLKEINL